MKRPLAFHQKMFSKLFTGWCPLQLLVCGVETFDDSAFDPEMLRSEEELLKFMGLMNSSWVLDGHDVVTAFNLSGFQTIVDLGGKRSQMVCQQIVSHMTICTT